MAETTGPAAPAATAKPASIAELNAAFPDLVGTIRAEAAGAERARILGIEQAGSQMKGHEALVTSLKADGKTSPAEAALAILSAENRLREAQLKGVQGVESHTGNVAAAPRTPGGEPPPAQPQAATPDGWKAEFKAATPAGEKLRGEFANEGDYVAFKANESKVRILSRKSA